MNSLLSRADLLRVLKQSEDDTSCHDGLASALAYKKHGESPTEKNATNQNNLDTEPATNTSSKTNTFATEDIYLPQREQRYWYVARCEAKPKQEQQKIEWPETTEQDSRPVKPLPKQPLRKPGQWQNLWDQVLTGRRRSKRIDVAASLRLLSRNEPLQELPRQERASFNRPVVLLLEWSETLYPIWEDLLEAWHSLRQIMGKRALRGFTLSHPSAAQWRCLHKRGLGTYGDIPAASQIILAGSFGPIAAEGLSEFAAEWQQLCQALKQDGHQVALISAQSLRQKQFAQYALEAGAKHKLRSADIETLLAAVAQHCLPNCEQLRQLRQALPNASVATELALWQHPDSLCQDGYLQIADGKASYWRERGQSLNTAELQQALQACRLSQGRLAREMSQLQSQLKHGPQAGDYPSLQQLAKEVKQQRKRGEQNKHAAFLMRSFLPNIRELADSEPEAPWQAFLQEAQYVALYNHQPLPLQDYGLEQLAGHYALYQQHQELRLQENSLSIAQGSIPPLPQPILPIAQFNARPYCQQSRNTLASVAPLSHNQLDLSDQSFQYQVKNLQRPTWAERIWRNENGIFAEHSEGAVFQLQEAKPQGPSHSQWQVIENPWPWAENSGIDTYGLWAEFSIQGKRGSVRQCLRWIPPGIFTMGSPQEELERRSNETQHRVTLSQGYWLADTACTQALWQAVMGKNPSDFKQGPENPVEQVSWHDCQKFIAQLNKKLPQLQLRLPSEAEWEFACRAGSTSPFSWGEALNTSLANYDGNYPYAEGPKGEYRKSTLAVKSFQVNPWGLYQMHGNVWEWCNDYYGEYLSEPRRDPQGPSKGQDRVLRGGSWLYGGGDLRCACRDRSTPDERSHFCGLRLAGGRDPQARQQARSCSADRLERSDGQRGAAAEGQAGQQNPANEGGLLKKNKEYIRRG